MLTFLTTWMALSVPTALFVGRAIAICGGSFYE